MPGVGPEIMEEWLILSKASSFGMKEMSWSQKIVKLIYSADYTWKTKIELYTLKGWISYFQIIF